MRFLMDFMSGVSYFINQRISITKYKGSASSTLKNR